MTAAMISTELNKWNKLSFKIEDTINGNRQLFKLPKLDFLMQIKTDYDDVIRFVFMLKIPFDYRH